FLAFFCQLYLVACRSLRPPDEAMIAREISSFTSMRLRSRHAPGPAHEPLIEIEQSCVACAPSQLSPRFAIGSSGLPPLSPAPELATARRWRERASARRIAPLPLARRDTHAPESR